MDYIKLLRSLVGQERLVCALIILSMVAVTLSIIFPVNQVAATIWEYLDPEEVIKRAEVVVEGKYDFSAEQIYNERTVPFCGVEFAVDHVYKGEVPDYFTAGVDCNDKSLLKEFQQNGGKLVLFLKNGAKVGFLIPVGGPNGIVKIKNGNVQDFNEERRDFFEEYLKEKNEIKDPFLLYLTISILLGLVVVVIFTYVRKNRV